MEFCDCKFKIFHRLINDWFWERMSIIANHSLTRDAQIWCWRRPWSICTNRTILRHTFHHRIITHSAILWQSHCNVGWPIYFKGNWKLFQIALYLGGLRHCTYWIQTSIQIHNFHHEQYWLQQHDTISIQRILLGNRSMFLRRHNYCKWDLFDDPANEQYGYLLIAIVARIERTKN